MKPATAISIFLVGVGLFLAFKGCDIKPVSSGPKISEPASDLKALVLPLKIFAEHKSAQTVSQFYSDFAEVVSRDKETLKTYGQFRSAHQRAQLLLAERTDFAGSMPGLSAMIDAVLISSLGKDDVAIDRVKLTAALNAVAWALGGG